MNGRTTVDYYQVTVNRERVDSYELLNNNNIFKFLPFHFGYLDELPAGYNVFNSIQKAWHFERARHRCL